MPKLLFIHHSTGGKLLHQGNIRGLLTHQVPKLALWDHGYNLYQHMPLPLLKLLANRLTFHTGLSDQQGNLTGTDFDIKLSNNNPCDFTSIFCDDPAKNQTLAHILEFDIVAFKNCFPTTKLDTDQKLQTYKTCYITMAKCFANYRGTHFIAFTPPPLRKERTTQACATRAKAFAMWLTTTWKKPSNVLVFDFFDYLADSNGYLKKEYCSQLALDSHPNRKANEAIAPVFVKFLATNFS